MRETLFTFGSRKEAYEKERELISQIEDKSQSYNMHEGGDGGFEYINKQVEVTEWRRKGGINAFANKPCPLFFPENIEKAKQYWFKSGDPKQIEANKKAVEAKRKLMESGVKYGSNLSGEKSSQYGHPWYINSETKVKCKFRDIDIPPGWVLLTEYTESLKDQSKAAYGKRWYHSDHRSYLLLQDSPSIVELKLQLGRRKEDLPGFRNLRK
jgi:hypothetical protein